MFFNTINNSIEDCDLIEDYCPEHTLWWEEEDFDVIDGFSGEAYAAPTDAAFEAIHLVAQTEAVILDPNYTGKSMSALIDRIRSGIFTEEHTILFLHSGGLPQVFAFNQELAEWEAGTSHG